MEKRYFLSRRISFLFYVVGMVDKPLGRAGGYAQGKCWRNRRWPLATFQAVSPLAERGRQTKGMRGIMWTEEESVFKVAYGRK